MPSVESRNSTPYSNFCCFSTVSQLSAARAGERQQLKKARIIVDDEAAVEQHMAAGRQHHHGERRQRQHADTKAVHDAGAALALVGADASHQHQHGAARQHGFRQKGQQVLQVVD
jgi:hypothetical protein